MIGDLMSALWNGVTDFGEMIFDLFDKVGAFPYIVAFSIIGLFVSFIIMNRLNVTSKMNGKSDSVKRSAKNV